MLHTHKFTTNSIIHTAPSSSLTFLMASQRLHDSLRSLALLGLKPPVAFGRAD